MIVETVGVGQVEVEVAGAADTTVVVVNPGWGDAVQANKAGLMEVADIFVVNKADRAGAGETRRDLESMLAMSAPPAGAPRSSTPWAPTAPAWPTSWPSSTGTGPGWPTAARVGAAEPPRLERELRDVVTAHLAEQAAAACRGPRWEAAVTALLGGESDPWATAAELTAG